MGLTRGAAQAGQKGGRAGEAARTHGRGVSEEGVYLGHTIHAHVFPSPYVLTGGLVVSDSGYESQAPVFESRPCR